MSNDSGGKSRTRMFLRVASVRTCLYIDGRFEDSVCWNEEAILFKKEYKDRQGNFC